MYDKPDRAHGMMKILDGKSRQRNSASDVERIVMPLTTSMVIQAIRAVDNEAARRGEMYPQTYDEQREDRAAVRRVTEMLEWYDRNTGCNNVDGWPLYDAIEKIHPLNDGIDS